MQQITKGICVSVETFYNEEMSNPGLNEYVYAYQITIQNFSDTSVCVKKRFWEITDGFGNIRQVTGEGVVGRQPFLDPGQSFQYMSGVAIKTDMGKMQGYYEIENLNTKELIQVRIPCFQLCPIFKQN